MSKEILIISESEVSKITNMRTAIDCMEDAFIAFAVSFKLLYIPVPTINLDLRDLPAILKKSFVNFRSKYNRKR